MMMKRLTAALAFAAVALAIVAAGAAAAMAQGQEPGPDGAPPAPGGTQAVNGPAPGEAVVSWRAVDSAPFYRIGWVAMGDVAAAQAEGRDWLDAFAFSDVANRGQTSHTVKNLAPCIRYAFIAASLQRRFGDASWSEWVFLTPTDDNAPCPATAPTGTPTPTQTPTPTPTPTPTSTPRPTPTGAGDYDADKDGLIEVANLAQLAAIRADLNGDGVSPAPAYAAAFPDAMPGMGCPDAGCTGYELVADLDFDTNGNGAADAGDAYWNDGAGWIPIGDSAHKFTADFDGNNHTIANLYINRRGSNVGLFGCASRNSIKQVGIVSATVSGFWDVGGLVGDSYNVTISASYATGSISGDTWVGGLVGSNVGGTISSSYATGNVSGDDSVGGLVGLNYGTISDSYAIGDVSGGGDDIGGLVGRNGTGDAITASYAAGRVSTSGNTFYIGGLVGYDEGGAIAASYWDTQATGQAGSYGGVGQTTAELQSPTTNSGIYAAWDASVWDFGNSRQYPALKYGGLDVGAQRE